ncbi:MAG: hypothetical protein ACI86M_003232 [Saprospiraceae bacterium]|jgi:hypothetical protein
MDWRKSGLLEKGLKKNGTFKKKVANHKYDYYFLIFLLKEANLKKTTVAPLFYAASLLSLLYP